MMANWDPVRFATTAAFFNAPPSPGELLKRVLTPSPALSDGQLWSAERPELLEWGPLDDVVMGGVSRSTFVTGSSCATFSGVVTSENNGGFAGCRTRALRPALDLRRFEGLRLRLRGDGNRYKLILRDDYAWNGIAWAPPPRPTPLRPNRRTLKYKPAIRPSSSRHKHSGVLL